MAWPCLVTCETDESWRVTSVPRSLSSSRVSRALTKVRCWAALRRAAATACRLSEGRPLMLPEWACKGGGGGGSDRGEGGEGRGLDREKGRGGQGT